MSRYSNGHSVIKAVKSGDSNALEKLIMAGVDVKNVVSEGASATIYACRGGHAGTLDLLIKHGAELSSVDETGMTGVMAAASGGHYNCLVSLLGARVKPDLSLTDSNGYNCAHYSAQGGHGYCLNLLIGTGKINIQAQETKKGNTAATLAAHGGHDQVLQILVDEGADLEIKNREGETALLASVSYRECLRTVLEADCNVNAVDANGNSAAILSVVMGLPSSLKLLIDHDIDLTITNTKGLTAFTAAILSQQYECLELLSTSCDPVTLCTTRGDMDSPLLHAKGLPSKSKQKKRIVTLVETIVRAGSEKEADSYGVLSNGSCSCKYNVSGTYKSNEPGTDPAELTPVKGTDNITQ